MRRLWRKGMLAALAALQTTGIPMTEDVNYDGETKWSYEYSEGQQHFQAPATGIYCFNLYGAQGASMAEHAGGKGGSTSVELELTKNDRVDFFIGNIGNVTNSENMRAEGGGATKIYMEDAIVAVAGGGGGATILADGGQGGISQNVNDRNTDMTGIRYTAGGGSGYQDGTDGYIRYHVHTGSMDGGGCYTQPFLHTHDDECYTDCGAFGEFRVSNINPAWIEAQCDHCSQWSYKAGSLASDFVTNGTWRHRNLICSKDTNKVEFYQLGCGKNTSTVETSVPSFGGSSYYDETLCRNATLAAGTHEGNGRLDIRMTELDGTTLSYYQYDMTPLADITVARGDYARYPITYAVLREKNNKHRYEFIGWDDIDTKEQETLKNEETVKEALTRDRQYCAVYEEIPMKYSIVLDLGELGKQTIIAAYGEALPDITVPHRDGYSFEGFFSQKEGTGEQYYNAFGNGAKLSDFTRETTLYPFWKEMPIEPESETESDTEMEAESEPETELETETEVETEVETESETEIETETEMETEVKTETETETEMEMETESTMHSQPHSEPHSRPQTPSSREEVFSKTDVIHEKKSVAPEETAMTTQSSETVITYDTKTETTTTQALSAHAIWQNDTTHPKTENALTSQTIEPSEPQTTKEDRILAQPLIGRENEPATEATLLTNGVAASEELSELDRTERALAIGIISLGMMLVFLLLFLLYRYREDSYAEGTDHYNR